jgi:hypothetical protein
MVNSKPALITKKPNILNKPPKTVMIPRQVLRVPSKTVKQPSMKSRKGCSEAGPTFDMVLYTSEIEKQVVDEGL